MVSAKIALISSIPAENDFLEFHYQLRQIAEDKFSSQITLLKNGEFCFAVEAKTQRLFYCGQPFDPRRYDLALARLAIKASHGGDYYVLRAFEEQGIPVINPSAALAISRDKLQTLQLLAREGLPITATAIIRGREQLAQALELIGPPPYIIKNCFGSGGRNVLQASSVSQVYSWFDYLWYLDRNQILLLQPYLATDPVGDVRAIYLDYRPWRAIVRQAPPYEFRANVKLGATPIPTELSKPESDICARAARCLGLPLAGIDFLRTSQGPVILEVNGCPGFGGIGQAYHNVGIDIHQELVAFLQDYRNSEAVLSHEGVPQRIK